MKWIVSVVAGSFFDRQLNSRELGSLGQSFVRLLCFRVAQTLRRT